MAGIYIYSDKKDLAAELIGFAKGAGREAVVLTLDEETANALQNSGADRICLIKGSSPLIENYAKAMAEFLAANQAELFAVGATSRGRDLAARVAGYLDCGMLSDVSTVNYMDNKLTGTRMMYGGAVIQNEEIDGFSVVTIPAGKFEPVTGPSPIITVELAADTRVSLVETAASGKQGTDLAAADKVVCIGMGMDKKEDMQLAFELADALGAEIACTRGIAEERHWLPLQQYIGISGAVIKPKLYISMGVSGQIQHIFGIRDAQIIAAVDTNEKAPIFKAADYGIVGDMYEVVPALIEALKR